MSSSIVVRLLGGALAVLAAAPPALAVEAPVQTAAESPAVEPPVATVNGVAISTSELSVMMGTLLAKSKPTRRSDIDDAQVRAREELILNLAQAQEALKLGLDKDPGVAGVLAYQRASTLARAYQREMFRRNPVDDATVEQEYNSGLIDGKVHEFHLAHVLLANEGRALEIVNQLGRGEKFADLAKIYSVDGNAPNTGGDMAWMRIDMLDEYPFVDAVKALKVGEYTKKPVRGASGWHVIRLVEPSRAIPATPKFADIPGTLRDKIRQRTAQRALDRLQAEAVANAVVTRATDLRAIGSAPPAAAAPANP